MNQMAQADEAAINEIVDMLLNKGITLGAMRGFTDEEFEAVYALGYNLYNQAKYEEALKAFAFLTFYNHLERRYYKALGACQQMLQRYDQAIQSYSIASVLDITDPEPTLRTAECLLAKGEIEDAKTALELVVADTENKEGMAAMHERAKAMLNLLAQGGQKDSAGG